MYFCLFFFILKEIDKFSEFFAIPFFVF